MNYPYRVLFTKKILKESKNMGHLRLHFWLPAVTNRKESIFFISYRDSPKRFSSKAPYLVFKDFLNLASNSVRYSRFLIHSPLQFTYSGELILPILFTTESCDSPHHFSRESPFVSIICLNSRLSFNTESQYFSYCLLQRVTTPHLIYSGESLLTAESYFQKLWRIPLPLKG
jgi:hypothetical protein